MCRDRVARTLGRRLASRLGVAIDRRTPSSMPSPSPAAGYVNPVMVNDAPDPSIIRGDDGAFYAYTTQAYHDVEFTTLPILRSTDLVTWELVGDAFAGDARPSWIVPGSGNGDVWAPHIARVGGKYLLYYSASSASTLSFGIGVAVADSPTGPFRDLGEPLLTGPGFTTIDPFVLDDDGDLYLYWGSAHEPIWVQPLAPDGLSLTGSDVGAGAIAPPVRVIDRRSVGGQARWLLPPHVLRRRLLRGGPELRRARRPRHVAARGVRAGSRQPGARGERPLQCPRPQRRRHRR